MKLARHLPRFRRAYQALGELAAREQWSRTEIERFQLERINDQWRHAIVHVPYYRNLAARESLPQSFDSLADFSQQVPILKKAEVNANSEDFLSDQRAEGSWHRTGGSTGQPLKIFRSHDSHCRMLWQKYRMEQAWGVDFFDRKAFLWGHAASFAPGLAGVKQRVTQPCLDWLRNRIRLNAYQLSSTDLAQYVDEVARRKVKVIYGYSSAVTLLAAEAQRQRRELPELKLAILTAEPADPDMLETCEAGLSANAAIEYGSVECGIIATGMPDGTLRVREDAIYLEAIPRADGRYDLLVTVLDNPEFPLLRYAIEDITDEPLSREETGFAVLKNVSGRSNDMLVTRSGRPIHPLAVKHAIEQYSFVRRFNAHQDAIGNVQLTIEALGAASESDFEDVRLRLRQLLEEQAVDVKVVAEIPPNRAGKHRWVTSEIVT